MSKQAKKGKRQLMKERREQQARRQRLITILVIVGIALILVAFIAVPAYQSATTPVGEFVEITPQAYPEIDGLTMGDPNAPVTIEIFEDFKCSACKNIYFPPRLVCPECGHREFNKVRLSRNCKLLTYTIIHVAPSQFTDQVPYAMGIVELEDGVRLLTQIADCALEDLKTAMDLRIEFRRITSDGEAGIIHYGYKCVPVKP